MALYMLSVSLIMSKSEALKKIVLQKHHYVLQKSENRQVTRFTMLIFPIDYCVRINTLPAHLFSGDIQS